LKKKIVASFSVQHRSKLCLHFIFLPLSKAKEIPW
jgi:hypothetical protein